MEDMNEFIRKMEANYPCSDFFKNKMRETIQRAFEIENDSATKHVILNKIEETYARHAENQKSLNNIMGNFREHSNQISTSFGKEEEKVKENKEPSQFNLNLD